jgi:PAS domain S-box-containing protein/putative nucleotidyltransferase with HDIG domain
MSRPLRVLIVEDSESDALLAIRELHRNGYEVAHERVDTAASMRAALEAGEWDLILCDYSLPGFGGREALEIARESGRDTPFVLMSGLIGEEAAVDMMRSGAKDFVMKDRPSRLGPVVRRELADAATRQAMARARIEWVAAFDSVQDAIFFHDPEFRVVRANLAYARLAGMPIEAVIGKPYWQVFPRRDGPLPACAHAVEAQGEETEEEFTVAGGDCYSSRAFPIRDAEGRYLHSIHVIQDVTERNRVRESLEARERHLRKLIDGSSDVFLLVDREGRVVYRSLSLERLAGASHAPLPQGLLDMISPADRPRMRRALEQALDNPALPLRIEVDVLRDDGAPVPVEIVGRNRLDDPDVGAIVLTARDASERIAADRRLAHVNQALRTLLAANEALLRAKSEGELLEAMCRAICEVGGYHLAWVAYRSGGSGSDAELVAWRGAEGCGQDGASLIGGHADDGATSAAIRSGLRHVRTCPLEPGYGAPAAARVAKAGSRSIVTQPLQVGGETVGALAIVSADPAGFAGEELKLLGELAEDLAYGIDSLRSRAAGLESAGKLRRSLETTVETIAATLEMRDPYTAGHERRVSLLAVAIARELGLDEDTVDGIHFGAMIHDLGKIQVPAEILSKPSRLLPLEYALIQQHPQAGYDILKGIDFPWPVATMVAQHHERLDGSGYPTGLRGDEIILEARILAVADVVEAMASHRPYRPGLGIDQALEEIAGGRGVTYDAQAADACVRLFREKGFTWDRSETA